MDLGDELVYCGVIMCLASIVWVGWTLQRLRSETTQVRLAIDRLADQLRNSQRPKDLTAAG